MLNVLPEVIEERTDDFTEALHDGVINSYAPVKNDDEQNLMPNSYVQIPKIHEQADKKMPRLSIATIKSIEKIRGISCRTVLWYVVFVGFMVNYMYRININIAIVEMILIRNSGAADHHVSECLQSIPNQMNSTSSTSQLNGVSVVVVFFAWFFPSIFIRMDIFNKDFS